MPSFEERYKDIFAEMYAAWEEYSLYVAAVESGEEDVEAVRGKTKTQLVLDKTSAGVPIIPDGGRGAETLDRQKSIVRAYVNDVYSE